MPDYNKQKTPQMALEEQRNRENQKWYAGESPTRGETLAQIGKLYAQDQAKGLQAYKNFLTLSSTPSSAMYSPYMSATNKSTTEAMAAYGVDVSNINDEWFKTNSYLKDYNRVGSTGSVLGTAQSATDYQNMASLYSDLYDQEQNTKKAENEWAAMQDAVRYWASRTDLNMSDEEILNKINWNDYPTLAKMEEGRATGAPMLTTRAVGYDKDLLKGIIYQTRNNGGSGNLLMDSASYYAGTGNGYAKDDATRARLTYGSDSYNPYVVSGTINDIGLYFGQSSFNHEWLDANADILNGTDETAKKNYHKVQDAVSLTTKANDELAQLNAKIDNWIDLGLTADSIMGSIDRALEDGTYPTLNKLQGSLSTGELLNTAAPINYDYNALRESVTSRVNEKQAAENANGMDAATTANEAEGVDLVNVGGTDAEKAFFESMRSLSYNDQVNQMWLALEGSGVEMGEDFMQRSYQVLAESFNSKWANQAEDVMAGYADYQNAVKAYMDAELRIEQSPEYKRLQELGYTGAVNDYVSVNNFLDTIDEAEYDVLWEPIHDMYADLAQADYDQDWNYAGGVTGREYRADYAALEAFRRRGQINEDASILPILEAGEDYNIANYSGLTADDLVGQVVTANEGVTTQEASAHVATSLEEENARLAKEVSTLESAGYKGDMLDQKKRRIAANERLLQGVEYYNLQERSDFEEKAAAGAELIDTSKVDPGSYKTSVSDDGKVSLSLMVYNNMTEDEKARLQYLAATDPAKAKEYLDTLTDDTYGAIPARVSGTMREASAKFAADHPLLATAASVIVSPAQLVGTGYSAFQALRGKEINPNSNYFGASQFIGTTRAQVTEDIDAATADNPVANFLAKGFYNTVTSLAGSMLYGGAGKIGLPAMVASNAAQTVQSATARGADPVQALALGGVSALIEYATEKIPFDELYGAMKGTKKAAGSTFGRKLINAGKDAFKSGSTDAAGEGLSEFLGNVADQYVMQDKSEHNLAVQEYMAENPEATEEQAERHVIKRELVDIAMASFSGFLSGGVGVGTAEVAEAVKNRNVPAAATSTNADADTGVTAETPTVSGPDRTSPQVQLTAKKSAALGLATMNRNGINQAVTAALMSENDATQTTAKAMTLDLKRIIGEDVGSFMRDVFGAAYETGIGDTDIVDAFKKHLSSAWRDGVEQIKALAQDGVSRGKLKEFVAQTADANVSYTSSQAHEVIVNERMQEIMKDGKNYEGLHAARAAETSAKDQYVKAQKAVGDATKRKTAAVGAMNSARSAYDAALNGQNGNDLTAAGHAFMNAIDNVANINSALEAANKRMQEAKEKFDGAVQHYKDVGQRVLAEIRAKAEKDIEQALQLAEDKTVNDVLAAMPKTEAQEGQTVNADNARRAVVEQLRSEGMLDELVEVNRQIEKLEKQIAGNRQNSAVTKPLQKMLKQAKTMQADIVSTVEALVAEEVQRVAQTAEQEKNVSPATETEKQEKIVSYDQGAQTAQPASQAPAQVNTQETAYDAAYDEALKKYGAIEKGEKPKQDISVPKQISDELKVMRGVRTVGEAFTPEELPPEQIKQVVVDETGTYTPISNKKEIAFAENVLRTRGFDAALAQWEIAADSDKIPNAFDIALAEVLIRDAVDRGDMDTVRGLTAQLAEAGKSAGQAIQAMRIIKQLGGNTGVYYYVRIENRLNRELSSQGRSVKLNDELIADYKKAKTAEERQAVDQAIIADLAMQMPRSMRDKMNALAYLSMLSSPATHVRNIAGNLANVPMVLMKDMAGAFIDSFRTLENRTHSAVISSDYLAFAKQYAEERKNEMQGSRYAVTTDAVRAAQKPFKSSALNKANDVISGALEWGDTIFKSLYYPRILAGYLQAQKVDLNNVPRATLEKAHQYALKQTKEHVYQDDSAAAKLLSKLNKHPVLSAAMRSTMPFTKTPINVAKRALEYSVIGGIANTMYQGKKNGWNSSEVVDAIAKTATGGVMTSIGFMLRNAGLLTASLGDEPEDELMKLHGYQEYALNIGDTSFTISFAGPAAMEMMLGAEIAEAANGEIKFDDLVGVGLGILEPMVENTFLDGVVDLLSVGQYSQGGVDLLAEVGMQLAGSYVSQYIPAILGSIARTIDGTRRSTTTDPNSGIPESLQYQLAKALNKLPFVSFTRPAWTDEFGQTDVTDGVWQRAIENLVLPGYVNEIKSDPVLDAISVAYLATGDKGLIPESADRSFSESSAKHKLNGDDYANINEKRGTIQREALEGLISDPEWKNIDPLIQAEMIKDVYNYADNASRVDYVTLSPFSESWQAQAYKDGTIVETILGRSGKYAETALGNLYAAELVDFAVHGDWEAVSGRMASMTAPYPVGADLSDKQMRSKIESKLKTTLQAGDTQITPSEYDAVLQLYGLGLIDSTIVDELMAQ